MLSRTERTDEFHLKLSSTEKELYEEFLKTEEAALVLEMQQYFAQAKVTPAGSASTMLVFGRRSKTEWMSGSRRFVQTGIKTKTCFGDQGSDLAPNEKSVGQDNQGITCQEIREFKRSALRQRKSDPRSRKRGTGEGGEK